MWPIAIDGSTSNSGHGQTLAKFTCEAWDPHEDGASGAAPETVERWDASSTKPRPARNSSQIRVLCVLGHTIHKYAWPGAEIRRLGTRAFLSLP